uniref:Ymf57 n=1 Tax=Tetrahymena thermophila TaxID=5911 RepID=Q951C2_TETTH|nr:ymf57 [Tetrahymena thermophila]7TGH_5B Chain 5B, Ymf57 [Tetrahymena thermophila]8B6F_BY Chain BY, Ymf57 [Tetrahymena thermophila SB210]8BQS_BY Chain BY, Ymf57 [Tetrahymena thermophila SB210]8GYM_5B Chain 5B, Ymf57 [Tetrahymena thermophila SB210]8GYM_5b Chain 5b, Ymf57 [Tetrahymena thermophila SB210]8GZU_5B Chain 5B, Ymf57 [Tetrahymena thermophila SB210]8GZU_5b Chain 5b, Ymf57 [Tetrahymena thermophila SB210]AAK77561.1 ymf57 [Tetrahymena thermophila]
MLKNKLIKFKFFRFVQSGFYVDFIFKKFSEMFIRNIFIYSSIFFGEKFMIEYLTKKTIDSFIFNNNRFNFINLVESKYFLQILTLILYLFFITIFILFYI